MNRSHFLHRASGHCFRLNAAAFAMLLLAESGVAHAQFEPQTLQRGPKLDQVTAFPEPGTYTNTTGVALRAPSGAAIHYTLDGSKPTEQSARLEEGRVLFLAGVYDGDHGLKTGYTVRAIAVRPGMTDSDPATFPYMIERPDRTAYLSEEVAPGVRMIRDADNDKMFLIEGSKAFALIDTGMGRGALRDYVAQFTGGRPVLVIATHSHGDHIGQIDEFITSGTVFAGAADRPAIAQFLSRKGVGEAVIADRLKPLNDGATIDLGDRKLEIIAVGGHTPGSIAILDAVRGNLFTGDTFGNNSPLPPDVMWMQSYQRSIDIYLTNVLAARTRLDGRVQRIFTGHNDRPLLGTAYLDNLVTAIQRGLDLGDAALLPSWRPAGLFQLVEGDRFKDPNWFGVNINHSAWLPAPPERIAGLTQLVVKGARLLPAFSPDLHDYEAVRAEGERLEIGARATSGRSSALTLNARRIASSQTVTLPQDAKEAVVNVVAPNGKDHASYHIKITARPVSR